MDYVKDIRADEIIVQCESPALQRELELLPYDYDV